MSGLLNDLRFGIRMLIRTPLLSITAVVTLGLGVGVTTFTYSISYVFAVMPVDNYDRLMVVQRTTASRQGSVPFHDYRDFRDRQTVFLDLAAGYSGTINLAGTDGPPERVRGSYVTANAFTGLGISPILGRGFVEGDDAPGAPALLLLGFETWQGHFTADPAVVGRTVRVNGEPATVIGVMPEGFGFPIVDQAWIPLRYDPSTLPRGGGVWLSVWGYLREGVTPSAATADLQIIARQLEVEFPEQNEGVTVQALSFADGLLPTELYDLAAVLMAMVLGVLVVACANVANLLLARASAREKDVAIRSALGAKRSDVIRQLLAEAVVIAALGGLLGLLFVQLAFPWYEGLVAGIPRPYWWVYSLKTSALVFTLGVTIAAALVAGTLPAIRASGADVGTVLRDDSRSSSGLRLGRFSRALVVAELAVSCALLIGAGLARRSVMDMDRLDFGFDVAPVMTARVGLFELDYPDPVARNQFFHELLAEVRSDPATAAAAVTSILPGTGQSLWSFRVEGASYPLATDVPRAGGTTVSPGYFETFGIEVEEGRDFLPSESVRDGEPVVIVNRAFVDRYLAGSDPMGRRIGLGAEELPSIPWMRIVGVVPNVYQSMEIFSNDVQRPEAIYRPLGLADPTFMSVVVRTRGVPEDFTPQLREAVARVDPNLPLYRVQSMEAALEQAQFINRGMGVLFAVVSVVGLFLAVVGLYGVMDFSVSTRLREMGVRIAMGATRWNIIRLVFRRVYLQLGLGSALGLALGFALGKPMSAVLIGVESWDAVVSVTVIMILGLTCTAAAILPALKALRVDPVEALRAE